MADISSFVDQATIAEIEKGYDDLTKRNFLFAGMMQNRGRITYNHSGTELDFAAMISLARAKGFAKGTTLEYGSTDPNIRFTLPWRGMYAAESMDLWDFAMNRNSSAPNIAASPQLINLMEQKFNIVMQGLSQDFWQEAFNDGSDSALPLGLESFMGYSTCGAADRIARPNDTYGGRSTVLASQGGSWTTTAAIATKPNATLATDYPDGRGRPEYDATSPLLVHATSSSWTGTQSWASTAWRVIDQTHTWMMRGGGKENKPDLALMASDMWTGFRNNQETRMRGYLPHKEATDLGFPDTLNMDGIALSGTDFDIPAGRVYVLNLKQMELCCMLDKIFKLVAGKPQGDTIGSFLASQGFDLDSMSTRIVSLFMGQWKFRPKYIAKLASYES